ncbi:N5-carboxyaminoimidazole ribonucleotide synthase [Cedecea neteri]|uniref:N5-carboxyaminoimidazole ribonucleotide synthase n=1 Tax=Cedecea neteri TaxID=158822 RepID=A0A2X3IYZ2_9ENTR|nr:N5-carboxyaminoimidazole ribonucleotide synthase [Cedecea neteri]
MKRVCVLGNGQLGRMLRQAGEPLGIAVYPVGLDAEPEAVPFAQSVITAEIERWPETALTANWRATTPSLTAISSQSSPTA